MAMTLEELAIEVGSDRAREFLYTDKGGGHFFGEAAHPWSRSYHGFYSHMHEFVDGWDLEFDGRPLDGVISARVRPDRLERAFESLRETTYLLDDPELEGAALVVEWLPERSGRLRIRPRIDMRFLWEEARPEYDVDWDPESRTLVVASRRHLERTPDEDWPVWAGFACGDAWRFTANSGEKTTGRYESVTYPKGTARRAMARATLFRPGTFEVECDAGRPIVICMALGDARDATRARARRLLAERVARLATRRARLQRLLDMPGFESSDAQLERAAAWCRLSLDQLIMQQRGTGIYAGFPWFTTYWGRDSFIALPGASLVTGDFDTARTILRGFAEHQITDPENRHEGRLPNFVTVKQVQYATADGTWWWVRALQKFEAASGDLAFAESLYPTVQRALNGALRHRIDAHGFVLHGDGETWMDAGGEARPYSPRGTRAIEVQALFANALGYGIEVARRLRERADAMRWAEAEARLARAFKARFFDASSRVPFDHLDADDTADRQVRPNGMLAWFTAPQHFDARMTRSTIEQVRDRLAYPWSVGSLAADDPQFHPRHLALDEYYYDEAYHNGDVWLWLSGPLVSGLVALHQVDTAWQQTAFLRDEILERGVAGSLREIRDAIDTPGKDEFGGACAQAWSLSEFQRTLYEDYMGARPAMVAGRLIVEPHLPTTITHLAATIPLGIARVRVEHERDDETLVTRLRSGPGCEGLHAQVFHVAADGTRRGVEIALEPERGFEVRSRADEDGLVVDGAPLPAARILEAAPLPPRRTADR